MQVKYKKEMALIATLIFLLLLFTFFNINDIDKVGKEQQIDTYNIKKEKKINNYNGDSDKIDNNECIKIVKSNIKHLKLDKINKHNDNINKTKKKDFNTRINSSHDNFNEEYIDYEDAYQEPKKIVKIKDNKPENIVYTTSEYEKDILKSRFEYEQKKSINKKNSNHNNQTLMSNKTLEKNK